MILCVILVGFECYRDIVVLDDWKWSDLAVIARMVLVLLIASIPVAMPTVMTVTNALGAQTLAKKKAIVSRLEAIEELAGVDILCSDKTGTLTKNMLSLGDPILFDAKTADELILAGALASEKGSEDAIDKVVSGGVKDPKTLDGYQVTKFVPFDPVGKRTEGDVTDAQGKALRFTKGAPQVIIELVQARHRYSRQGQQDGRGPGRPGHARLGRGGIDRRRQELELPRYPVDAGPAPGRFQGHHRKGQGARAQGQDGHR